MRWQIDLPTLATLTAYWERYPPVHISVAAYLGIGKGNKGAGGKRQESSFEDLMASIPQMDFTPPTITGTNHEQP